MKLIANILWMMLGGGLLAIFWSIIGIGLCITVIGLPFGKKVEHSNKINILWLSIFGWGLALITFVIGIISCLTIIGIPIGIQWIKFARLALMPFGSEIK